MRPHNSKSWLHSFAFPILLTLILSGCISVKLVGDYDEQIDKGVTTLQKETESLLVKLESSAKTQDDLVEKYENHKDFYSNSKVSISGLRVRADALERNSLTVRMLDKLQSNINKLEDADRSQDGIKRKEISESFRPGLNAQFTAILTFELAKKRSEKPNETKALSPATKPSTDKGVTS